jgi:hypothetical protein
MSDYLINLVARNQESSATIQPRLFSLYEPAHGFNLFTNTEQLTGNIEESTLATDKDFARLDPGRPGLLDLPRPMVQERFAEDSKLNLREAPETPDHGEIISTHQRASEETRSVAQDSKPAQSTTSVDIPQAWAVPKAPLIPGEAEIPARDETLGRQTPVQTMPDSSHEKRRIVTTTFDQFVVRVPVEEPALPRQSVELNFTKPLNQPSMKPVAKQPPVTRDELTSPIPEAIVPRVDSQRVQVHLEDARSRQTIEPITPSLVRKTATQGATGNVPHVASKKIASALEVEPSRRTIEPIAPSPVIKPATKDVSATIPIIPRVAVAKPRVPGPIYAPAPEPVINVTIGRVEVRATPDVTTTPISKDTRKGSQLMGLDEYLRQRAQGGRR